MLYLTKQEKSVLVVLALVVAFGSLLNMTFQKFGGLPRWIEEKENFLHKTDVNRASLDELVRVPYIGEKSARKILDHRAQFGAIRSLQELGLITHLSPGSLEKAGKYLKI